MASEEQPFLTSPVPVSGNNNPLLDMEEDVLPPLETPPANRLNPKAPVYVPSGDNVTNGSSWTTQIPPRVPGPVNLQGEQNWGAFIGATSTVPTSTALVSAPSITSSVPSSSVPSSKAIVPVGTTTAIVPVVPWSNVYVQFATVCKEFNFSKLQTMLQGPEGVMTDAVCAVISSGWYDAVLLITQEMPYSFGFPELLAAVEASDRALNGSVDQRINPTDCISAIADVAVLYDDREEWKNIFSKVGVGKKLQRLVEVYEKWIVENQVVLNVNLLMSPEQIKWLMEEQDRVEQAKQLALIKEKENKEREEREKIKRLQDELDKQKAIEDRAYADALNAAERSKKIQEEITKQKSFLSMFGFP